MKRLIAFAFLGLMLLVPPAVLEADDLGRPSWLRDRASARLVNRRDSAAMMELVRPLCAEVGQATVQVLSAGKPVALGAIVSGDGYVLTKRSQLSSDPIRVRLADDRLVPARVAAVRREVDLALLHIDADNLQSLELADGEPEVGSFLVSVGRGSAPFGLGVVGVPSRPVGHAGRLGVMLEEFDGVASVGGVVPHSGADEAGILPGDRIVKVEGLAAAGRDSVMNALRKFFPGESVRLTIARGDDTVELDAQIREFSLLQETENDARVNGRRSSRLNGFERALQHDTVLDPDQCGGPVLDSQGRVVGLNIARAGRVVSYALPSGLIKPMVEAMIAEAQEAVDL